MRTGLVGRPPVSENGRQERRRSLLFVILALGLHAALLPLVATYVRALAIAKQSKAPPIKVVSLGPEAMKALRQQEAAMRAAVKPVPKPAEKPADDKLEGQVVDVPPTADDRAPENAKYLSEHNTRAERETRSRYQSQHYENAMNEPTTTRKGNVAAPVPPQKARALEIGPARPGRAEEPRDKGESPALEMPATRERDRIALEFDPELGRLRNQSPSEKIEGNSDRLRLSLGGAETQPGEAGSAPMQGAPSLELIPQLGVLSRIAGAPANDHLEDLEEGDGTFLNSRQFKYASFFNRLKRGVSENWNPIDEYRRRDPTGNIYGHRARVTVVSVTLRPDGNLENVQVTRSSGIDFLDREAVAAFQRAQPFPNPPKGLVDPQGRISFPFGFHIDFGGGFRVPF